MGHDYGFVALLGTNHTTPPFAGMAVFTGEGFETPLGVVRNDRQAAAELLAADPACTDDPRPHWEEHSIEVQLPFTQVAFPGLPVLPVVVGTHDPELCGRLGRALARVAEGRRALVVASSDLSHYPGYEDARASDRAELSALAELDPGALLATIAAQMRAGRPGLRTCACGEAPMLVVVSAAKAMGATHGVVLSYANSGDSVYGDMENVVGYGAVAFAAGPGETVPAAPGGPPRVPRPAPRKGR
jgi:hypothetical protein